MNISYNWLKEYLDFDLNHNLVAEILTDLGLEVEGISKYESVPGSLEGVVVGKITSLKEHPNADRLKITTVDIGEKDELQIICGAPNVKNKLTVAVATNGTTLYPNDEKLKIKKAKIRGELSNGMICGEDELNLGPSTSGIMILDENIKAGTKLNSIYKIYSDWIFEIGLTPNRADAMSHLGVARDLRARLIHNGFNLDLKTPSVTNFRVEKRTKNIKIHVEDKNLAKRYCGIVLENIKVCESPSWLKNKLKSIGINPINNIVDATNYVMMDVGQPLHAFDYNKIEENQVIIKRSSKKLKFKTLDETERTITTDDLLICDSKKPMCLAGVFGGLDSGVSQKTNTIFLESAFFDPVSVRKSAKYHNLSTDSSYRFERGIDPNSTKYALKRAVLLIKEICPESVISSDLIDLYPKKIEDIQIILGFDKIKRIVGQNIEKETIKNIISSLDIKINSITESNLGLAIPPYRNDVKREADVIEEILRVYGYNNIKSSIKFNQSIVIEKKNLKNKLVNIISNHLVSLGFYEIITNSLVAERFNKENPKSVKILNSQSSDLSNLRTSMIFSGLNVISHNINRQNDNLKLFEFGKVYSNNNKSKYSEKNITGIFVYGNKNSESSWNSDKKSVDFYYLKGIVQSIIKMVGIENIIYDEFSNNYYDYAESISVGKDTIFKYGLVSSSQTSRIEIENEVFYAELDYDKIEKHIDTKPKIFKKVSKFPVVSRDISILVDENIKFRNIQESIKKVNQGLIKKVSLFDVYRGKNLPAGKKSYGIGFKISDKTKTLSVKEIDSLINKIIVNLEKNFGAKLR
jgi:phenylalanyl-tRNA synthetase beta chain